MTTKKTAAPASAAPIKSVQPPKKMNTGRNLEKVNADGDKVIALLNKVMASKNLDTPNLKDVARQIGYNYNSLWLVYRGERYMPVLYVTRLCVLYGMETSQEIMKFVEEYEKQRKKD